MKIRYENKLDDFVAFTKYHYAHSPAMRRTKFTSIFGLPIAVAVIMIPLVFVQPPLYELFFGGMTFILIWLILMPVVWSRSIGRNARRIYNEGTNGCQFGPRELEIGEHGLIARSQHTEMTTQFEGIEKVVSDDDRTYIYVGPIMAHVIPRQSITDGNHDEFIAAIKEKSS